MRLLANENIPRVIVEGLRVAGHDVAWIRDDAPGASDAAIIRRAKAETRLILTFDKDFGELAFVGGLSTQSGVVLLRLRALDPETLTRRVVEAIDARDDWPGHFSVVESDRVRMTPLPPADR